MLLGLVVVAVPPPPHLIDRRQFFGRGRVGQVFENVAQSARRLAGFSRAAEKFDVLQAALLQLADQLEATLVARYEHGHGLILVLRQPTGQGVGHGSQFLARAELLGDDMYLAGVVWRVGLRIAGRRGLNVRWCQCVSHGLHRVLDLRPVNQIVGQSDDALCRAAGVGQLARFDVLLFQKLAQEPGVGRGEGLVDRLVGVADAHPVAAGPGQEPQYLLLQPAAILSLVLQDVGPLIAQPLQ